jgi:tetratricopeptide (TPR) repeat protein
MARAATPALLAVLRAGARSRSAGGLSEIGGALAGWKEVHAIEPGDAEARGQIAWLWIVERCARSMHEPADPEDEDARLAVACAEANYRARPEDGICARDLGAIRYHLGRLEEARPLLEKSWSLDRRLFSSILHLAMIEHHQGDPARARRLFEEAAAEGRKSIPEKDFIRPYFETILNHAERVLAFPSPAERP